MGQVREMTTSSCPGSPRRFTANASSGRGGGPGDHLSREVVHPVVARTPDLRGVGLVLHGAVEVRADGGEGAELPVRGADQDRRLAAELQHHAGIVLELRDLAGDHAVGRRFGSDRGNRIPEQGVEERQRGGDEAHAKDDVDEAASFDGARRRGPVLSRHTGIPVRQKRIGLGTGDEGGPQDRHCGVYGE